MTLIYLTTTDFRQCAMTSAFSLEIKVITVFFRNFYSSLLFKSFHSPTHVPEMKSLTHEL